MKIDDPNNYKFSNTSSYGNMVSTNYVNEHEENIFYTMHFNIESLWKFGIITIKQREKLLDKLQKKAAKHGLYLSRKKYDPNPIPVLLDQNEK